MNLLHSGHRHRGSSAELRRDVGVTRRTEVGSPGRDFDEVITEEAGDRSLAQRGRPRAAHGTCRRVGCRTGNRRAHLAAEGAHGRRRDGEGHEPDPASHGGTLASARPCVVVGHWCEVATKSGLDGVSAHPLRQRRTGVSSHLRRHEMCAHVRAPRRRLPPSTNTSPMSRSITPAAITGVACAPVSLSPEEPDPLDDEVGAAEAVAEAAGAAAMVKE